MYGKVKEILQKEIQTVKDNGLYKEERTIISPQAADINVKYPESEPEKEVINFCANNYLGLSNEHELIAAAKKALDSHGFGLSSVRFICGTQDIHKQLEHKISDFLMMEDSILYSSCFDANAGLFEALLGSDDGIFTDELNHASIIDGIRLSKAKRFIYKHSDMADLEAKLKEGSDRRMKLIATDGAFSMDGDLAKLDKICALADKYNALVMVDDSHCTGFIGKKGRGTHEHYNVIDKVDIINTTFGKALGGASGGCTSAKKEIVEWLRQRSRPYLFSNSLSPVIVSTTIKVIDILGSSTRLRDKLEDNTKYFRDKISSIGLDVRPGEHPIVPIMLYDAKLAQDMARDLYYEGIYVIGFSYPVVPKGQARIRVQITAGHEKEHIDKALAAFEKIGKKYDVINK